MELIIDKFFLDNFYSLYDENNIYHEDLRGFFKDLKNCKVITNYASFDEFKEVAEKSNPFLHLFIETQVPEIEFRQKLVINDSDGQSPVKLFFIDDVNEDTAERLGYTLISSLDIDKKWASFYKARNREYNSLKTSKDHSLERYERFEKWEDLMSFAHPFHSVILADRYILSDKSNQRLDKNLFPLLINLFAGNKNVCHVNIMIITQELKEDINKVYDRINRFINNNLMLNSYHFSLIINSPSQKLEHFRRIYTNYFYIRSENSFNYFKENGSYQDKNNNITFEFIYDNKPYKFAKKELADINKWIEKINNRPSIGSDTEKIYFIPDKGSNLFSNLF